MTFAPGYLADHPLPSGILGALGLGGYQLLADVAGVGAGRLGSQVFLLVAPEQDPAAADVGTQISLHQKRLKEETEAAAFTQLAAQLGYMRLSGYRLALERHGLRSKINVVNPATGGIAVTIPDKHPGGLFGGGTNAAKLLAGVRSLPPAGAAARPPEPGADASGAARPGPARRERQRRRGGGAGRPCAGAGPGRPVTGSARRAGGGQAGPVA